MYWKHVHGLFGEPFIIVVAAKRANVRYSFVYYTRNEIPLIASHEKIA